MVILVELFFLYGHYHTSHVQKLKRIIETHRAKEVLLLSSRLVKPLLESAMIETDWGDVQLHVHVPRNEFLGGNIMIADLLTVQDYIASIESFIHESDKKPELVIIPSSGFSHWGKDITGQSYLDIERRPDVRVALIRCEPLRA